jgi:Domain of unknown function (DUF4173)
VIESWFSGGGSWSWQDIDVGRVFSWLVVFALIWAFLHVRRDGRLIQVFVLSARPPQPPPIPPEDGAPAGEDVGVLFGRTAIVRSLVLFNALFGVQTAMDIAYLWSGMALPDGLTYASYAQRGAYALMAAALLAAGFVLAAMRPGSEAESARPVRALVHLWIGQTVLLVISSILRLDLYVDAYSLTEWRCAAFVWMLLVAVGLVLISARITLGRSNVWLVWRNGAMLLLTLYVCSFVDFSGLIADFNVAHSREVSGTGQSIDVGYLCDLGPAAIPALDVLMTKLDRGYRRNQVDQCRQTLTGLYAKRRQDWRAFTLRDHRLRLRLDHGGSGSVEPAARPAAQANGDPHGAPHPGG